MAPAHRVSMTAVVIVCLLSAQWNCTLFASEPGSSSSTPAASPLPTSTTPDVQAPTSLGLVPAIAIGEQSVETTNVSPASESQTERARFSFDAVALNEALGTAAPRATRALDVAPARFEPFAGQIYQGAPYPYRARNSGAVAAVIIGAAAVITGAAVLAYANRPLCTNNPIADGCGYGPKVVGTAALSGGIIGLFVGALTWR
jgi:hypothetical protein